MIYTLTLNPAVDRELVVPSIEFDTVLRATASRVDLGGKGFNVSRQLKELGVTSTALALAGGAAGRLLQDGLQKLGIATDFVWLAGETRTNVSIVAQAHDRYVKANEPGPYVDPAKQQELVDKVAGLVQLDDWWVLSGSLPPGIGHVYYATLVNVINDHGGRAIVDTSGEALRLVCARRPFLVKPNSDEARAITGLPTESVAEVALAAAAIQKLGARNVVVSIGKAGALLNNNCATWLAHSPEIHERNPIGAGDALVAGLVWALSRGVSLDEALRWGVACGAATASLDGTAIGSKAQIEQLFALERPERL